jgi:hypothetical protein
MMDVNMSKVLRFVTSWMLALMLLITPVTHSFILSPSCKAYSKTTTRTTTATAARTTLWAKKVQGSNTKLSPQRRQKLGIADDEDEYDLDRALENNTDPLISKIVAGSLILVILGLLIVGVIVPSLTDYGEGVCSPIQNGGRC